MRRLSPKPVALPASRNFCELEGMLSGATCFAHHTLTLTSGQGGGWGWCPSTAHAAALTLPPVLAPGREPCALAVAQRGGPSCAGRAHSAVRGRRNVLPPPPGPGSEIAGVQVVGATRWVFQGWSGGRSSAQAPA